MLQALMGVGLRALAIDTIVTIDIHKYCGIEFLMLKNIQKTINHKNLGMVSCLFVFDILLSFFKAILHVILGRVAYETHSNEIRTKPV